MNRLFSSPKAKIAVLILTSAFVLFLALKWKKASVKTELVHSNKNSPLFEPRDRAINIIVKEVDMETGRPLNVNATIHESKSRYNQMKQAVLALLMGPRSGKAQVPVPEGMELNEFYF